MGTLNRESFCFITSLNFLWVNEQRLKQVKFQVFKEIFLKEIFL